MKYQQKNKNKTIIEMKNNIYNKILCFYSFMYFCMLYKYIIFITYIQ